jgi:hypothetical protein
MRGGNQSITVLVSSQFKTREEVWWSKGRGRVKIPREGLVLSG